MSSTKKMTEQATMSENVSENDLTSAILLKTGKKITIDEHDLKRGFF